MLRSSLGLSLVGVVLACNGGIGVTDASSYGTTTDQPSGDPSSNSDPITTSATGTTTAGTTTAGTTTGGQNSSGSDTGGTTEAATSIPTTGTTTSTSTGDPTTGEPASCLDVSREDYGDCDAFLGYAYDGSACRAVGGCDCGSNCDHFFASAVDCASS